MTIARILSAPMMLLASFTTSQAADLKLEDYFAGKTYAFGKFTAINGTVRKFRVNLIGTSKGKVFSLREDFVYEDGVKDTKTWQFTKLANGKYSGTREDVKGTTTVTIKGNVAKFNYLVDLSPNGKENLVRFYDTLTKQSDGTMLNTAWVTKYGVPVAKVSVNFATTLAKAKEISPY